MPAASPKENARYRRVIPAPPVGARTSGLSVRIACYNPKSHEQDCVVTIGIGPADPDANSIRSVRISEELWDEIDRSMREALQAAK